MSFSRKLSHYIVIMFVPSILLTNLSFLNFWIDTTAVTERDSLAITTILAQVTLIFTFCTLFQIVAVSYLAKKSKNAATSSNDGSIQDRSHNKNANNDDVFETQNDRQDVDIDVEFTESKMTTMKITKSMGKR